MTSYLFEIGYVKGINCINGDVSERIVIMERFLLPLKAMIG